MNIKKHFNKVIFCRYNILQIIFGVVALYTKWISNECEKIYLKICELSLKKYIINKNKNKYYDIKGVKLIDIPYANFESIFLVHTFYNDNYDKKIVEKMEQSGIEAPYCYKDGSFDITVKENDIVIDAGASVGEFCAYTAYKKAICYAFEPTEKRYEKLYQTAQLNPKYIIPVKKGLSDNCGKIEITTDINSPSFVLTKSGGKTETIETITLDEYADQIKLERIDFIKSDIEGAERNLLMGSRRVLKEFAPKLSICTYHLPDDPEVLTNIIMEANSKYKIIHLKSKLMAMVMDK